jgi:hypothetical protein
MSSYIPDSGITLNLDLFRTAFNLDPTQPLDNEVDAVEIYEIPNLDFDGGGNGADNGNGAADDDASYIVIIRDAWGVQYNVYTGPDAYERWQNYKDGVRAEA